MTWTDDDDVSGECVCPTYITSGAIRHWDADCPKHGEGTPWWERLTKRAAELARERDTREAR